MRFIVALYTPTDPRRAVELAKCLAANIARFEDVVVLAEDAQAEERFSRAVDRKQVRLVSLGRRATFADALDYGACNGVNVLANADCTFDDTIVLADEVSDEDFWCVTRRDAKTRALQSPAKYSQDAWVWRGVYSGSIGELAFPFGALQCDNRMAHEARAAGYRVSNPCDRVNVWHHHAVRDDAERTVPKVEGACLFVEPPAGTEPAAVVRGAWDGPRTTFVQARNVQR